jgi:hypothetical protein
MEVDCRVIVAHNAAFTMSFSTYRTAALTQVSAALSVRTLLWDPQAHARVRLPSQA